MLGYGEEDSDTHLSSSCMDSADVGTRREEGGLGEAVYAVPHRNQVFVTFQNFFCTLTLTYRKLCRLGRICFSLFCIGFCLGAISLNVGSLIFDLVRLQSPTLSFIVQRQVLQRQK